MIRSGSTTLTLPHPVAFVLSGGTSLGAIQVGMVRALHERGIAPDLLVGSSVGSINAAYVAGGYRGDRIDALTSLWTGLRALNVFGSASVTRYLSALRGRSSLAMTDRLRAPLERHLPARQAQLTTLIESGYSSATRYLASVRVAGPGVYGHPRFQHAGRVRDRLFAARNDGSLVAKLAS